MAFLLLKRDMWRAHRNVAMHRVEQEGEEDEDVSAKMKDKMKRKEAKKNNKEKV